MAELDDAALEDLLEDTLGEFTDEIAAHSGLVLVVRWALCACVCLVRRLHRRRREADATDARGGLRPDAPAARRMERPAQAHGRRARLRARRRRRRGAQHVL